MRIKYESHTPPALRRFQKKKKKRINRAFGKKGRETQMAFSLLRSGEPRNLDTSRDVNERRRFFTTKFTFHSFILFFSFAEKEALLRLNFLTTNALTRFPHALRARRES